MATEFQQFYGSSNVDQATYDDEAQTVTVLYVKGEVYNYGPVTPQEWAEFKNSPSPGSWVRNLFGRET